MFKRLKHYDEIFESRTGGFLPLNTSVSNESFLNETIKVHIASPVTLTAVRIMSRI